MGSDSSSGDEDEEQIARLQSVAVDSSAVVNIAAGRGADHNTAAPPSKRKKKPEKDDHEFNEDGGLKYSQIRVQNLLHKHLDKNIGASFVELEPESNVVSKDAENEDFDGEVRLFSRAPLGINLKRPERSTVIIRPKRYESSDEDEAEKISRLQAAAVDGTTLLSHAKKEKSKARAKSIKALEASEKAEKDEKQRVAKLRRDRGEEWLPKVATDLRREQKLKPTSNGQVGRVMDT